MEHILAKDLKESVIETALLGKISIHNDNESVDDLIRKAEDFSNNLSYKKKILPIDYDLITDDIPGNWTWIQLGKVCSIVRGLTFSSSYKDKKENTTLVLRGGNIDSKTELINFDDNIYVDTKIVSDEQYIKKDDTLIVASSGTKSSVGKSGLIVDDYKNVSFGGFMMVVRPNGIIHPKLLSWHIKRYRQKIISNTVGYISNITIPILANLLIPLPPIEEQQRIVDKVDELMAKIDEYEKIENQLVQLKEEFPGNMRNAILQAAFCGKLTEQSKDDSDALELAEKIKEKRTLKGKSKYITDSEFDIDVPENWAIIKSGECFSLDKAEKVTNVKLPYLEAKYLRGKTTPTIMSEGEFVKKGTKVILVDGENSGEIFIEPEDGIIGSTFKVLYMPEEISEKYALYFLEKNRTIFRNNKKGAAIPHLSKELFNDLSLPIPPIEEQQRIVDLLDKVLPLCDSLQEA